MTTDRREHASALLKAPEVARRLSVSVRHVRALHSRGALPTPIRLGRSVRWCADEIDAWIAAGCPPRTRWEQGQSRS